MGVPDASRSAAPAGSPAGRLSIILSTYRSPDALELVLWGYSVQTDPGFEIVVADDGSGPETAARIDDVRERTGLEIAHVRHEDEGFRKCRILNRAIERASGDYVVISDGDCIPRADFVAVHRALARPGRFLSGGRSLLSPAASRAVTREDVVTGALFRPERVRADVPRAGDRRKLAPRGAWLDRWTPTRATWNGHNASTWRADLVAVNGFDERLGYGGEDRELGERLRNAGLRPIQVRHRAALLHLDHERGYVDLEVWRRNDALRRRTRGVPRALSRLEGFVGGPTWTEHGIRPGPRPDPAGEA